MSVDSVILYICMENKIQKKISIFFEFIDFQNFTDFFKEVKN